MNEKNQSYIQSVALEGYKSIQHTEIDFEQGLNIIIGKNGSGKTNFLEFLFNIIFLRYTIFIGQEYSFNFKSFKFSVCNQGKITSVLVYREENLQTIEENNNADNIIKKTTYENIATLTEEDDEKKYQAERNIKNLFRNIKTKISYETPKNVSYIEQSHSFKFAAATSSIESNSKIYIPTNFIAKLDISFNRLVRDKKLANRKNNLNKIDWKNELENYFLNELAKNEFLKKVQKFSPIQDLRLSPNMSVYLRASETSIENIYIEFKVNNEWYSWDSLSDGTKRLFYIISEVVTAESIVLLEEPELGIHPHQLHLLMQFLKEQSETKQIILTTHSPQVLDILNVNELNKIIIAEMTEEGTKLRHLTEKQKKKATAYMEELFLSDYWVQNGGLEDEE